MYYIVDRALAPLHVFVDQYSLVEDNVIGFLSAIGSRKALEDVRTKLASPSSVIRICPVDESYHTTCYISCGFQKYKFFFRKLDNAPFWVMTVMNPDIYNSCQDLVRGIQLSEKQRKLETSGDLWTYFPIYFLFLGAELFKTEEEMKQFMHASQTAKYNMLIHNPAFVDTLYKKLASCSRLPFLREWMEPLLDLMRTSSSYEFASLWTSGFYVQDEDVTLDQKVFTFKVTFNEEKLKAAISHGLSTYLILMGNNVTSGDVSAITTLTDYLNRFSDNLIEKAHERFNPLYTPGISLPSRKALDFFTSTRYFSNLDYYAGQQDVISSVALGLARNKRTLIVGECGIGNYYVI